jgi:hypothetical protein
VLLVPCDLIDGTTALFLWHRTFLFVDLLFLCITVCVGNRCKENNNAWVSRYLLVCACVCVRKSSSFHRAAIRTGDSYHLNSITSSVFYRLGCPAQCSLNGEQSTNTLLLSFPFFFPFSAFAPTWLLLCLYLAVSSAVSALSPYPSLLPPHSPVFFLALQPLSCGSVAVGHLRPCIFDTLRQ